MFGDTLKELRESRDMTQKQLAELVGISDRIVGYYEANDRFPKDGNLIMRFAEIFNVTIDYLLGYSVKVANQRLQQHIKSYLLDPTDIVIQKSKQTSFSSNDCVTVPILGTIKGGYDLYGDQQVLGYEKLPKERVQDGEYFFLKVTGRSMIDDGIKEGYRVLVRRQDFVDNGKVAVVIVNGNEGTLKRVFYQKDMVILQASNSDIPPRIVRPDEILIQGQVVKVEFDI